MARFTILLLLLAAPAPALAGPAPEADPPPPIVDLSAVRQQLRVFSDGKGHFFVFVENLPRAATDLRAFFGGARLLYRVPVVARSRLTTGLEIRVADPRQRGNPHPGFVSQGQTAHFQCGKRRTTLQELEPGAAAELLAAAELRDRYWRRVPQVLARDPAGTYYLVDHLKLAAPIAHRLFRGQPGQLRRLALRKISADPAGQVFTSKEGALHLVLDRTSQPPRQRASWVRGRQRVELQPLDLAEPANRLFMYRTLGIYSGLSLQLPCDVW